MLTSLKIENFRSIRSADLKFSSSGLNVVIGANGSGKSNLVKFLEFISSAARSGLHAPIQNRGKEGFVPKSIPTSDIEETQLRFRYQLTLPGLPDYPADAPVMQASHEVLLAYHLAGLPSVTRETLHFDQPLLLQQYLSTPGVPNISVGPERAVNVFPVEWLDSYLEFARDRDGEISILASPPVDDSNVAAYLRWFNLSALEEHFRGERAGSLVELLANTARRAGAVHLESRDPNVDSELEAEKLPWFLDRERNALFALAPEFEFLRRSLMSIRRYDLQLTELRREQRSQTTLLSREGRGMPGALRYLQKGDESSSGAWERIMQTMQIIAPHVLSTQVGTLSDDREFIEFIESQVGRPVESWESSDGTLRALAILVALERHPARGIILIEEPEQGLHPWAITALMDHVRAAIQERELQVILTTHSQQLLEAVDPDELFVAERTPEHGTRFLTLDQILPANRQVSMGDVGRMWVKGLLRGVPLLDSLVDA
jgi:predicted ATPase